MYTLISAIHLAVFLVAAYSIITSSMPPLHKILWLVLVLCFPFIGAIIYFLVGKK